MTGESQLTECEQIQRRLAKLKIELDLDISYRLDKVFAQTSGWGGDGEIKRRAKLLRRVEPQLGEMLLPNEEVLYVAKAVQQSYAEAYLMGALWATMLNQTVFVLTNLRLLMLRSNSGGKPLEMFWVIYYSQIQQFKPTWTGVLQLKLEDQKKLTFTGFSGRDRKAMPVIFQEAIEQYERLGFDPEVSQSRENLCAHCYGVVPKGDFDCDHCGAVYWTPRQLATRSLVFPSWGDFCMKHYGVAAMELVGYGWSWAVALYALSGPDMTHGIAVVSLIFVVEHPLDAYLTYIVANKGLNVRHGPAETRAAEHEKLDDVEEVV